MWKFIQGTDNKAIITSDGKVFKRYPIWKGWNPKRIVGWSEFREVKPWLGGRGYLAVTIPYRKDCFIHQLVAEAFIPNPENKPCIDHIDGDRTNNSLTNLRWVTFKENSNNPNTKYKSIYSGSHRIWTDIQGFNPKSNHRTPIFRSLKETSTWITPEGKDTKPSSLQGYLNKKAAYRGYYWTAKVVTAEEYQDIIST